MKPVSCFYCDVCNNFLLLNFQIIPRVMPALVPEANLREKFDNEDYVKGVEDMFREKFLANLDVSFIVYLGRVYFVVITML